MNDAKIVNIARMMTTYNFEIKGLPDNLKCAQCKLVLKNACQLPCCCRFCRVCIDGMIAKGGEFCPGNWEDCSDSLLSCFSTDHVANKGVSRLVVKCPYDGCVDECALAKMDEHLQECPRKTVDCPFRALGCTQNKSAAEEMDGHLNQENRRHSEILIAVIANINKEIETLKHELVLKDGQIKSVKDQVIHLQNENELIKNDIKSIKEEKEDLAGRVKILTEQIGRKNENDELDSAKVIEHVDKEIAAVTQLIESKKGELAAELQSVRDDTGSINQGVQSINKEICSVKSQVELIQALVGKFDASFVWLIDDNVSETALSGGDRLSENFIGEVHPYKYRLAALNNNIGTELAALSISLNIDAGPSDEQLTWPFEAKVVIVVTDKETREACKSISLQCRVERPPENGSTPSNAIEFLHSELTKKGLNLTRGVRVLCVIVPGACQ